MRGGWRAVGLWRAAVLGRCGGRERCTPTVYVHWITNTAAGVRRWARCCIRCRKFDLVAAPAESASVSYDRYHREARQTYESNSMPLLRMSSDLN